MISMVYGRFTQFQIFDKIIYIYVCIIVYLESRFNGVVNQLLSGGHHLVWQCFMKQNRALIIMAIEKWNT